MTKYLSPKYDYSKALGIERLSKESILLPFKDDQIDWLWIEEFMEGINLKKEEIESIIIPKPQKIDTSSWKSFKLVDLFDISKGKDKDESGEYPLITCATSNRGRHNTKTSSSYVENIITVSGDGAPGIAFWQKDKVGVFTNVNILKPKFKHTNNICLFLETVLTKSLSPKYNYGKKLGLNRIIEESIFLPFKEGQPDWEYMENFMNDLIVT